MVALSVAFGTFLVVVGVSHFVWPHYYLKLVPPWLPAPRLAVVVTGLLEVAIGASLFVPGTRHIGALASAVLMGLYVGSHIDALRYASSQAESRLLRPRIVAARILVNVAYLAIAGVLTVHWTG